MDTELIILAFIILLAFSMSTMTGFGANVISIALAVHLYPLEVLLPVMIPLNIVYALLIILRHHCYINMRVLKQNIIPFSAVGLLFGIFLFNRLAGNEMLIFGYGLFLILYSTIYLLSNFWKQVNLRHNSLFLNPIVCLLGYGLVQGVYASGGPLLVIYANHQFHDKHVFRSTLAAVFFLSSMALFFNYLLTGKISSTTLIMSSTLLPPFIVGFSVGEWLHFHIDRNLFRFVVIVLLLVAGFSHVLSYY